MKSFIPYALIILFYFIPNKSYGQLKRKEVKKLEYKGDNLIWDNNYTSAKLIFQKLSDEDPKNKNYQYKLAVSNIHIEGYRLAGLNTLIKLGNQSTFENYNYHIALGYYYNQQFNIAKPHFEKYLEYAKKIDNKSLTKHVQLLMNYNSNAEIQFNASTVELITLENLGLPVNTENFEYTPYITPDEKTMIFTYLGKRSTGGKLNANQKRDEKNGRYHEDLMITYKDSRGQWTYPELLTDVNTNNHDACAGITFNGDRLFIYKNVNSNQGDIYYSDLNESGTWSKPRQVKGDINTAYWEGSVTTTTDERTLYFSSDRPGGYGGKDIYSATLQRDGTWGDVQNLGPSINSEYDEDAAYIHPDNTTLYFSSNGAKSVGGYDVFHAEKRADNTWHNITNAGVPINTINNDRFYILSADGKTGFFARDTKTENIHSDILIATPGRIGKSPLLIVIEGQVFLNRIKKKAKVVVIDLETSKNQGIYKTNPQTGLFTMLINPGKDYVIDVQIDGETRYTDTLRAKFVDQFLKLQHNYDTYTKDYKGEIPRLEISLQDKVQKIYNKQTNTETVDTNTVLKHAIITNLKDTLTLHQLNKIVKENRIEFYTSFKSIAIVEKVTTRILDIASKTELTDYVEYKKEDGYEPRYNNSPDDIVVNDLIPQPTEEEKEKLNDVFHPTFTDTDLVFRVQVAAYRKPENYSWHGDTKYGDVLEVTYPDGITRFTIGGTKHIEEINSLRIRLIKFGIEDAFIVAFKGSKRVPLYEHLQGK